jgi:sugar phosphate isomerase/epimerase
LPPLAEEDKTVKKTTDRFPLCIQTALPQNYRENHHFISDLRVLQELGFYGMELNIADPGQADFSDIRDFLGEYDLRFTNFATGLTAKRHELSLSSADSSVRQKSIAHCKRIIDQVSGSVDGIIVGFLKGPAVNDADEARKQFADALAAIAPHAQTNRVRVLVEATNRYESSVANGLEETARLIRELNNPFMRLLPDTFHMNIEEADGPAALKTCAGLYDSVHISDNNRHFPGFGALRFDEIITTLKDIGFDGTLGIEGNIKNSFSEDVRASATFLAPLVGLQAASGQG